MASTLERVSTHAPRYREAKRFDKQRNLNFNSFQPTPLVTERRSVEHLIQRVQF